MELAIRYIDVLGYVSSTKRQTMSGEWSNRKRTCSNPLLLSKLSED